MILYETQEAISELLSDELNGWGAHASPHLQVAGMGFLAGEIPFDMSVHNVSDINPLSLYGRVTGQPQVREVFPEKPLDINVVVHRDSAEMADPEEILLGRKVVMHELSKSLIESRLHGDRVNFFVAGEADEEFDQYGAEYIDGTKPEEAVDRIAHVCTSGLTLVLSTFKNLPVENRQEAWRRAIGIKVNHQYDLELQRNTGIWDTGEPQLPLVDTNDGLFGRISADLKRYRPMQAARHEQTRERLQKAGLRMASAVFDKTLTGYFDVVMTDHELAAAIRDLHQ